MNIFLTIYNALLYQPMLNFLVLIYVLTNNFGIAVILLTVLIKWLTNPLNKKAIESQKAMTEIQPRIKEIQKKYKDTPEKQAQEMIALYKEKNFNPFSSIFLLFIQIPIIIALFQIFKGGIAVDPQFMYSFVHLPETINPYFLGIDLSQPNIVLAVLAAIAQYFQAKTSVTKQKTDKEEGTKDKTTQVTEMMQKQMVFILPIITLFVLFTLPSALGVYWLITTAMTVYQQKKILKESND
ncbi:MAG: YidC/Oxa1 family rane protein insertase [Patescibacteria group bacterium]|nr:YidC/Oxa1 family rane protein insertase [Patescibacteria group bacterium]